MRNHFSYALLTKILFKCIKNRAGIYLLSPIPRQPVPQHHLFHPLQILIRMLNLPRIPVHQLYDLFWCKLSFIFIHRAFHSS